MTAKTLTKIVCESKWHEIGFRPKNKESAQYFIHQAKYANCIKCRGYKGHRKCSEYIPHEEPLW